jgi:hypothetical protein
MNSRSVPVKEMAEKSKIKVMKKELEYSLKPESRGEYVFDNINVYVHAPL